MAGQSSVRRRQGQKLCLAVSYTSASFEQQPLLYKHTALADAASSRILAYPYLSERAQTVLRGRNSGGVGRARSSDVKKNVYND